MNPELLMQILSFLWATFETGLRGFLLGFGLAICKECLMRDLRDQGDRDKDAKHSQQTRIRWYRSRIVLGASSRARPVAARIHHTACELAWIRMYSWISGFLLTPHLFRRYSTKQLG